MLAKTKTECSGAVPAALRCWTIMAPIADFADVESAAEGENDVDWTGAESARQVACTVAFAASEIAGVLRQIAGETVALRAADGSWPETTGPLVILLTPLSWPLYAACFPGVSRAFAGPVGGQSYKVHRFCHSGRSGYLILGGSRIGALYGAYAWLQHLGVRWFSPDPWDTDLPEALPATLPDLALESSPAFQTRGFMGRKRGDRQFLLWMARQRLNKWGEVPGEENFCRKTGILWLGGGHDTFGRFLPANDHFAEHPEWYGLRNGARSPKVHEGMGDNICLSNPEARAAVADNVVRGLREGPERVLDIIQLWPFDHYDSWCECPACAVLGNKIDQMLLLAHDVRQAIRRAWESGELARDVLVSVCAYHNTLPPPSRPLPADFDHAHIIVQLFVIERCFAHALADARCTESNAKLHEIWTAWNQAGNPFRGRLMIGEYYNVSTFAGMSIPFMQIMAADIPYYHRSGATDMDYMHVLAANWGTHALTNSQYAAMVWNPDLDVASWLADFRMRRYGRLAAGMREWYAGLEQAMRNCKPLKHYMGVISAGPPEKLWPLPDYRITGLNRQMQKDAGGGEPVNLFDSEHLRYAGGEGRPANDGPSLLETVAGLQEAARRLDHLLLEAGGDPVLSARLISDARRFRYTCQLVQFIYHLVRLRLFEHRGESALAGLEARSLRVVGEGLRLETEMCRNFKDAQLETGLGATFHSKTFVRLMQHYFPQAYPAEETGGDTHPQ